jgi:hypothetical protein
MVIKILLLGGVFVFGVPGNSLNKRVNDVLLDVNTRRSAPKFSSHHFSNRRVEKARVEAPFDEEETKGHGGPDQDMWFFKDSDEPDGPHYAYYFPTATIGLDGDDQGKWVSLPFDFRYRGVLYDSVFICTNGFISFSSHSVSGLMVLCPIHLLPIMQCM